MTADSIAARYAGRQIVGAVHELEHQGVRVLVVAQDELFDRAGIYGGPDGSYGDNGLRFAWFCAAALEALRETTPAPDAILAHDWPAALAPVLLRASTTARYTRRRSPSPSALMRSFLSKVTGDFRVFRSCLTASTRSRCG